MDNLCVLIIQLLHLIFILFILVTPFTNIYPLLLLHIVVIPFMLLHWMTNNNICAFTILEHYIRKEIYSEEIAENETFIGRLVMPVYDFNSNHKELETILYIVCIVLWLVSVVKVYLKLSESDSTVFDLLNY